MRLGQNSYHSVFWTSLAPHCLFTRERNGTIAYRSTFRITYFIVPLFGTERSYFKRSRVNATPERSTFRNGTIWNGTIAFPCERGLSFRTYKLFTLLSSYGFLRSYQFLSVCRAFDHIGIAILRLFVLLSTENYPVIVFNTI